MFSSVYSLFNTGVQQQQQQQQECLHIKLKYFHSQEWTKWTRQYFEAHMECFAKNNVLQNSQLHTYNIFPQHFVYRYPVSKHK